MSITRVVCDESKEHTEQISIPHERVINLVFWYQKRFVGDVHFRLKFALKGTHFPLKNADFHQYLLIVSTVRISEICSITANRKSITRFPTSCRWSAYVTHNSRKGGSKSEFVVFANKIQVQSNKVCHKVSLCENFQKQSCSKTIPLSKGVLMLAVNVTIQPNI